MNDDTDDHVIDFDFIMQDYSFILSVSQWATADLVKLANIIDIELQQRADDALSAPIITEEAYQNILEEEG